MSDVAMMEERQTREYDLQEKRVVESREKSGGKQRV